MKETLRQFYNRKSRWTQLLLQYTACFALIMLVILVWNFCQGRTLVEDTGDGTRQRLRAMYFYSGYLKDIVKNLFTQHRLVISDYSFAIGQGSDVVGTLQYFAEIGDPLAALCVFVPLAYLPIFYSCVVVARLYLAGLFFLFFCHYKKFSNHYALLSGAFVYVFCNWAFVNIPRYPHYLIPMVYFPLVLLGIEMVIEKRRPYLLTVAVAFCSMSNFYYFYVTVFLVVAYVAFRLIILYRKDVKSMALTVLRIGIFAGCGVLLAAVIIFPVLYAFTHDARTGVDYTVHLLYPMSHYSGLPSRLISYGEGSGVAGTIAMGSSIFGFLSMVLLFLKKKKPMLRIFSVILLVMSLFPIFGSIMNGFSYSINRWCFALALLEGYLLVEEWEDLWSLEKDEIKKLFLVLLGYAGICLLCDYSRIWIAFAALFIGLAGVLTITFPRKQAEKILLALVILSVALNGYYKMSPSGKNGVKMTAEYKTYQNEFLNNETRAINDAKLEKGESIWQRGQAYTQSDLVRYTGQGLSYNAGLSAGMSSTVYYWSISNPYVVKFRQLMGLDDMYIFRYTDDDNRTMLTTAEAVRYCPVNETNLTVPYGYELLGTYDTRVDVENAYIVKLSEEFNGNPSEEQIGQIRYKLREAYDVYENQNPLPLAFTYDNYMSVSDWQGLNFLEKQEALLKSAIIGDATKSGEKLSDRQMAAEAEVTNAIAASDNQYNTREVACEVSYDGEITPTDSGVVTTSDNCKMTLTFEGVPKSETYLVVNGFDYKGTSRYDLYLGSDLVDPNHRYTKTGWDMLAANERASIRREKVFWEDTDTITMKLSCDNGSNRNFEYHTREFDHYTGRHDFALNLNYSDEAASSVTITFPKAGTYSFSDMKVMCLPMTDYESDVANLKTDAPSDLVLDGDVLTGSITLSEDKVMCIALPYAKGWTAYVDGQKAELLHTNVEYMGLYLTSGTHNFELRYETPFLKLGTLVSVIAVLCYIIFVWVCEKKMRRYE